jgi:hypothetical protein
MSGSPRPARLTLVAIAAAVALGAMVPAQEVARPAPAAARSRAPVDRAAGMQDLPADAARPSDVASYDIDARLDAEKKTVTATARITWNNPSPVDTVPDLWFHLYLNAFRDRDSTFWRESHGQLRGLGMPADGWGSIELTALRIAGGTDLLPRLSFQAPDDGNVRDRTVARVVLPQPVPPGGGVELEASWTAKLPKVYARTGYAGDFFLVAQWFPKLAVFEPPGRRGRTTGAWNAHQFHADSEFYADFGHYRVAITVPAAYVVGATGVLDASGGGSPERRDAPAGTRTFTFEQAHVHDFAWTASPRYVAIEARFEAATQVSAREYAEAAARLGRPVEALRLPDVAVRLLLQPEHRPQARRYLDAAMLSIKEYGLAYGPYPYRTLTLVDPPEGAEGAGGMEYPTFVTVGTNRVLNGWPFDRLYVPELVTVHEFAHQYFQGLLASNEFEEAWLDEGFATYTTAQVLDAHFGPDRSIGEVAGLRIGLLDEMRLGNSRHRGREVIRQPSWTYDDGYAFNSYSRPALALRTLERQVGGQAMARILRAYVERWRFRHPSSDDFYAVASEVAGRDLRPFFRQAIESPGVVDFSIGDVTRDAGSTVVTVRRDGDLQIPVAVAFTFAGGRVERRVWDGQARFTRFRFETPDRLQRVDVDPDRNIALDVSWLNNGTLMDPDRRPAAAMTSRWLLYVQQGLGWLAF